MTALLLVAALGGLGAVIAGTASTTAWWLGRNTPKPTAAPTVEQMAGAMHTADTAVWDHTAITVDNPMYSRHAAVALSLLTSREVTRRG